MERRLLSGKEKLKEVQRLLTTLKDDLESSTLSSEQQQAALEQLKIYGRDAKDAGPIFTKDGIQVLTKYGLTEESSPSSLEALRCLANAMLLEPKTRQMFVDLGCSGRAAERLKSQDSDNEFLISRILFLTTYECNLDFNPIFSNHALGESINFHIARHARQFTQGNERNPPDSFDQAALSESLKLLFNISNYYPRHAPTFTPTIKNIFKILNNIPIPQPPLQPPINCLINALVNLDLQDCHASTLTSSSTSSIFPADNSSTNIDQLIKVLGKSVSIYSPPQLESLVVPLLTVLRKIQDFAPEGPQRHMQLMLLPKDDDRDLPLGQSDTLPSKLLRLSTSPVAPNLRESISSLLFELSGKDANRFVQNVGYGFAAGFLLSHDIPVPESVMEAQRSGEGNRVEDPAKGIQAQPELVNPVTGQKLNKEPVVDMGLEMSDEEKEREAERLFVLFERLKATGVVDVKNPIREAVESGRFEEVGENGNEENEGTERLEEVHDNGDDDK